MSVDSASQGNKIDGVLDTLLIRGVAIPVSHREIDQSSLRFYDLNPRIYSIVRQKVAHPSQEEIEKQLLGMDHVKQLIQDIKRHGGLIEPVIVRSGTWEVLEGNSRLAAYRALYRQDPIKWSRLRAIILPEDTSDDLIFALLAQLHVKGKKDWAPFEQAGFLYRRYTEQKIDIHNLALESNLSQQRVRLLIDTYKFMMEFEERDITKWSHYEEYLKSRAIAEARAKFPTFDRRVVSLIQSDRSFKAVDVRDRLPKIVKGPTKNLRKFADGTASFDDAYEVALDAGVDNNIYRKMNKFRQWLAETEVANDIRATQGQELDKVAFELEKIRARIVSLTGIIQKMREKRG